MAGEDIYKKEKRYLNFINILIVVNIFLVIVIVSIYLQKKSESTVKEKAVVGLMPPNFRIRPVKDIADAKNRTIEYIASLKLNDLTLKRIIVFKGNYYIYVKEATTGRVAFALNLIKLGEFTLKKFPSVYPQMMWNKKYGIESGVNEKENAELAISMERAMEIATDVTKKLGASYSLTKNPDIYYGFYEFIVFQNDSAVGELSINGDSGKVFYKTYPTLPLEFYEFI